MGAFGLVYVVWGSTYLAIAWAVETIPPLLMIGARCLVAGGILYGWTRRQGAPRPAPVDWLSALVAGTLLFVSGQALLAWAETRIASGVAALVVATEPAFILLLSWLGGVAIRTGPRPSARTALALLAGFTGVWMMVLPGTHAARPDAVGVGAALLATLSWSAAVTRTGPLSRLPPVQVAGMQLLGGGVVLSVLSPALGELRGLEVVPSLRSLAAFGYLVVFGSVLTFAAYAWLLRHVGPARLSTHTYVNPVVAVALGAALGHETVSGPLLLSMALILGSVVALVGGEASPAEPGGAPGAIDGPTPGSVLTAQAASSALDAWDDPRQVA